MSQDDYVLLEGVEVGIDSNSGAAVSVEINGTHHWVPYSQIRAIHRDKVNHNNDKIEVRRWLAEKNGWLSNAD